MVSCRDGFRCVCILDEPGINVLCVVESNLGTAHYTRILDVRRCRDMNKGHVFEMVVSYQISHLISATLQGEAQNSLA